MNAKEALEKAWKLIEDPNNRCIDRYAVNELGFSVKTDDPGACKFCSLGALKKVCTISSNFFSNGFFCNSYYEAESYLREASYELFNEPVTIASDKNVVNNPPQIYARAIELASLENK